MSLFVHEIFSSIQGESTDAGLPCVFVRLYGCPIGCSYCDQPQNISERKKMNVERVISEIRKFHIRNVCITGGEPLIQEEVYPLIYELVANDFKVSVETSGCVYIEDDFSYRSYKYIMDVKCPSSGVSDKNVLDNLLHLIQKDEVKFVIANKEDYLYARNILRTYSIPCTVLFSPVFDKNNKPVISQELINWMVEDGFHNVRLSIQIHKCLGVK
jgi:7-carboxy-7-deazaguanine synthase